MKKLLLVSFTAIMTFCHNSNAQLDPCGAATDEPPGCFLCGSVYSGFTAPYSPGTPGAAFPCGTIENNQWLSVIAGSNTMNATIISSNCQNGQGVQLLIYDTDLNPVSTCFSSGGINQPGNVVANSLTPGEVYWIMIDGFAGDVCDFTLTVIGGVSQGPPNPTGPIKATPDVSPVCPGAFICYSIDPIINAIDYEWNVPSNAIIMIGGGRYDTEVCVKFTSPGSGIISVQANNPCFSGTPSILPIAVIPIPITFQEICSDDFPVVINGNTFPGPGTYTILYPSSLGCDSTVQYQIFEHPTELFIDTTICSGTEIIIDTFSFDSAGVYDIVLPGAGAFGCDSLITLTLNVLPDLEINSYPQFLSCTDSCTTISVDADLMNPDIVFEWFTDNGIFHSPPDNLMPQACGPGNYILTFTDTVTDQSCSLETIITTEVGTLTSISPISTSFCVDDNISFETDFLPAANEYTWTFSSDGSAIGATDSNVITVTFDLPGDKEICVHALNDCDTTSTICLDFAVNEMPTALFTVDSDVCVNQPVTISYAGNASSQASFNWNFGGGTIISGTGSGPYEISWNTPGTHIVTLSVEENGCLSAMEEQTVSVVLNLNAPDVRCDSSTQNQVFIGWDAVTGAVEYEVIIDGVSQGLQTGTSFVVDGLVPNDIVTAEVIAVGNGACNSSSGTVTCEAIDCPDIMVQLPPFTICQDDPPMDLPRDLFNPGSGCTWSGPGVDPINCRFHPDQAGAGSHYLYVTYSEGPCLYEDSTLIHVIPPPAFSAEVLSPIWHTDLGTNSKIDLTFPGGAGGLNFLWSNGETTEDLSNVLPGDYCVTVTDNNGCENEDCFTVGSSIYRVSTIVILCQGESERITIRPSRGANFSWSPSTGLSCTDCPNPIASPTQTTIYEVTATLPDGRSSTTPVFVIVLPPPFCPTSLENDNENGWKEAAAKELQALEAFKDFNKNEILKWIENETDLATVENEVRVYPNPFENGINIFSKTEEINQIEIFGLTGNLIFKKYFNSQKVELSLKNIKKGNYILRIKTTTGVHVEKILKM